MPKPDIKKLSDLRVADLKLELERRGLDKNGVKMVLIQRIRKSLEDEGVDPDNYHFDLTDPKKRKNNNGRKSSDESHCLENSDSSQATNKNDNMVDSCSSPKEESVELSKEVLKVFPEEVVTELHNNEVSKEECKDPSEEVLMAVTEQVSKTDYEMVTTEGLKDMHIEKEPEKGKNMETNAVCESSIEDLVEDDCIDFVVVEEDEDQLHLGFEEETLHDRETCTSVKSRDDSNSKDETGDMDNPSTTKCTAETQNGASSRKSATLTQTKTVAKTCPKVVWVSNVSHSTSASELQDALSAHGNVIGAKVVVNARYPGSSCYGYVTMASNEDVDNVIDKLNNTELNGQIIKLGRKLNDKMKGTARTRSEDPGKNQGKKAASEKGGLQRNRSIERSRSMGKGGSQEGSYSNERFNKGRRSRSPGRRGGILTFAQIKEERERQKIREQERAQREASRRRQEEIARQKDIDRRQRQEAMRIEREKEKLRIEKEKLAKEREELMELERERYKIAQEKIELERTLSRLQEGGLKRHAPHRVNDRKRFAMGNRHFDAPNPRFHYAASKNHSETTGKFYGASGNNYEKSKPYDGGNYCDKRSRNYAGPSRSSSSKYDRKPYDRQDRTSSRRPNQSFNEPEKLTNDVHMYKESGRNSGNDMHYNRMNNRSSGSSNSFQTSATPNWRPSQTQNDRLISGNPQHLRPWYNTPSNLNLQFPPPTRTANFNESRRFDNARSAGSSMRKL